MAVHSRWIWRSQNSRWIVEFSTDPIEVSLYNTTCPHLFLKIFVDFLTSTLLRTQNKTFLSKVRRRFFFKFCGLLWKPKLYQITFSKNSYSWLGSSTWPMSWIGVLGKNDLERMYKNKFIPFYVFQELLFMTLRPLHVFWMLSDVIYLKLTKVL